jgi:hypothetical protein
MGHYTGLMGEICILKASKFLLFIYNIFLM